ncbi:hypothetical protein [Nocardia brasiliensis]|uniref:hypothetical protein n=1 Tax=Nocardia brasiliensis TaxID=37326 RepID=UPI00245560A9|nr:hypothetical protein [Nocardia brasiliensis]
MSVLPRAVAPPAAHEVAVTVTARLCGHGSLAPQVLPRPKPDPPGDPAAASEHPAKEADPALAQPDSPEPEPPIPLRIRGPVGLGTTGLLTSPTVAEAAAAVISSTGTAPPMVVGGTLPTPTGTAHQDRVKGVIPSGPTGLGTGSVRRSPADDPIPPLHCPPPRRRYNDP